MRIKIRIGRRRTRSSLNSGINSLIKGFKPRRQTLSMWQMNAGTNHGGRKKHKGILGF